MKKLSTFSSAVAVLLVLVPTAVSGASPQTPTSATRDGGALSREALREIQVIRAYCASIDRFRIKNQNAALRRDLVHPLSAATSNSASTWADWVDVTGDAKVLAQALAGAHTCQRDAKVVFVECFSRSRPNQPANRIRYYFWPDGTLVRSQTLIGTFQTPGLDNRVVLVREMFWDARGFMFSSNEEFLAPKTGKRLKPVPYLAEIQVGIDLYRVKRLRDLPFLSLLQKPQLQKPKPEAKGAKATAGK